MHLVSFTPGNLEVSDRNLVWQPISNYLALIFQTVLEGIMSLLPALSYIEPVVDLLKLSDCLSSTSTAVSWGWHSGVYTVFYPLSGRSSPGMLHHVWPERRLELVFRRLRVSGDLSHRSSQLSAGESAVSPQRSHQAVRGFSWSSDRICAREPGFNK